MSTPAVDGTPHRSSGTSWKAAGSAILLVAVVAIVVTLNTTAKFFATRSITEWWSIFVGETLVHGVVALAILLAVVWARRRSPERGVRRYALVVVAVVLATFAAVLAIDAWETDGTFDLESHGNSWAMLLAAESAVVFRFSFVGLIIAGAWLYLTAASEDAAAIETCAIDAAKMDRETAEARLQMLEAQIEPHFLFNTLAHVKRLYDTDRATGSRMLHNLMAYLSAALPRIRGGAATLGSEIDHIAAYLDIQQIRMGPRLAYAIDVPATLRHARVPSLMALTLVENAVKHGLSPLPEGGRIDIHATTVDGRLRIDVVDTGRGFTTTGGGGTGLANTRARLASAYGANASLALALNSPRGVRATIELPLERVPSGGEGA